MSSTPPDVRTLLTLAGVPALAGGSLFASREEEAAAVAARRRVELAERSLMRATAEGRNRLAAPASTF